MFCHPGSGRVPDQLVNLDMKHGVEAKNYEEVSRDQVFHLTRGACSLGCLLKFTITVSPILYPLYCDRGLQETAEGV